MALAQRQPLTADLGAVRRAAHAARGALIAALGVIGIASSASALVITGGPTYSLPGGGSCVVSNITSTGSGATLSCTSVAVGSHSNVYFGIRNDLNVNGNTMTGSSPASGGSEVFRYSSSTASSITYTSTTSVNSLSGFGNQTVSNRLVMSLTGGSATVVATGGTPADNGRGDIQRLFRITSSSFTLDVDVLASDGSFGLGQACPAVYDPSHAAPGAGGDISKVDVAFYFSDCGDGVIDSPEQCDSGGANGTPASCCSTSCTFKANNTPCSDDGNVCTTDTCNGASPTCQHPAGNAGTECRASAGVCDPAEQCNGSSMSCPADAKSTALCRGSVGVCDLPDSCDGINDDCPADAKSTTVCRATVSVCDLTESCDGVNDDCPADAFAPPSTECRASADTCDVAESCTGSSSVCPADSFQPSSTVCRGAADVCDVAENCTGTSAACPADGKSTAQCRAAAGVCDVAESCDGVNNDCPADAKSTAVCRAAAGVCDVADSCDGVGDNCPADQKQPDGLSCSDGLFCNGDETCQSGTCVDGPDPCAFTGTCSEAMDTCLSSACPSAPQAGCRTAQKNALLIKNKTFDGSDKLIWKFLKGQQTTQADFANPKSTATYALCIYAGTADALVAEINVPPSNTKWKILGNVGYKYLDPTLSADGAQKIILKAGVNGKSKALFKGHGGNLPDPLDSGPLDMPVTAQLLNYETGLCWEGNFTSFTKNGARLFKAKNP